MTSRLRRLLAALLPSPCRSCGRPLPIEPRPCGLCLPCRGRLRRPESPSCRRCATPLPARLGTARPLCGACRRAPSPLSRLLVGYRYEPPLAAAVRAFKFGGDWFLAGGLAELLVARVAEEVLDDVAVVTAVPSSLRRRLRRGFDPAGALAEAVARRLGLPFRPLLARRHAPPQASLPEEQRRRLPARTFWSRRGADGVTLLLVDDVLTTGATLGAAAHALSTSGAGPITGLVLARTERRSPWPPGGICGPFDRGCREV